MSNAQIAATVAPIALVATTIPLFKAYSRAIPGNWRVAWYLGLVTYWIFWCGLFTYLLIGKSSILELIQPQPLTLRTALLVMVPFIGAGLYKLVPGMEYSKPERWVFFLLITTNLGNGFFEELLWRGAYLELFPRNVLLGVIWPTLWFGLWHYAPGAIAPDRAPWGLMIGSGLMGFYLSFLARTTGTIYWTIIAHAIGGFIMIL